MRLSFLTVLLFATAVAVMGHHTLERFEKKLFEKNSCQVLFPSKVSFIKKNVEQSHK